jgi:hemerythrin-like metal-binding protein
MSETLVPERQASLAWSDALWLDLDFMDDTHREFVDLLAAVETSEDEALVERFRALVDHTDEHFGGEDRWMAATQFAASNCHTTQHHVVMQVLREALKRGQDGDLVLLRDMARELGQWFPQHAQTMDAALALHLRQIGFDPVTGIVHRPDALPEGEIHGCGGSSCSS